MTALVHFQGAAKRFGQRLVLPPLDLEVARGEVLAVTGPSGIGKSTLLRLAAGLERPSSGRILCRARRIGFVFQEHRLLPWCTILHNVVLPQRAAGTDKEEASLKAAILLEEMGLGEFLKAYPAQLSGGMRQRVALARAFAVRPDLLLLDEPFTGLDMALRQELRLRLEDFLAASGAAAILVTHDPQDIPAAVGRVLALPLDAAV